MRVARSRWPPDEPAISWQARFHLGLAGRGPRSCIAAQVARVELTLGLATLLRAAEITSEHEDFPLSLSFTLSAGEPIPAVVTSRGRPA